MAHRRNREDRAEAKRRKRVERNEVRDALPIAPFEDGFPEARARHRHFVLHVGPTNSGKTHDGIEALMGAGSGTYLAPLRLLALEVGERLRGAKVPTSIVTGEETDIVDGARHKSSTVEMLDTHVHYDVAVIDEAQMVSDKDRGGAWTRAIVGVNADVVHVCMAENAEHIVESLIGLCPLDDYEVVRHERQTPLVALDEPVSPLDDPDELHDGDALVCFSRKAVLGVAARLDEMGVKSSVVYGALPWAARANEARKFRDGETRVVVATDAIGMGMNLPIRRVVFLEDKKYDGSTVRPLDYAEYKQIAGRAGRRGMYDEGYAVTTTVKGNKALKAALEGTEPDIGQAYIGFPDAAADDEDHALSLILGVWANQPTNNRILVKEDVENQRQAAYWLESTRETSGLTRGEELALINVPFDWDRDEQRTLWTSMCLDYVSNANMTSLPGGKEWRRSLRVETGPDGDSYAGLNELEQLIRGLGIRYAFARAAGRLDARTEDSFRDTRDRLEDLVIRKLNGPKRLVSAGPANLRSYDNEWTPGRRDRYWDDPYTGYYPNDQQYDYWDYPDDPFPY